MFGLSNNNQTNQDDQVMLKNVSKLATDLNSTTATQQQQSTPAPDPSPAPIQQPNDTAAPFQPVSPVVENMSTPQSSTQQAPTTTTSEPSPAEEAPSSFSFPGTPVGTSPETADTASESEVTQDSQVSESDNASVVHDEKSILNTPITGHPSTAPQPVVDEPQNAVETPVSPVSASEDSSGESSPASSSVQVDINKLQEMKQQAMEHLDPLVDHLDQSPEETFRTTMMMIQANDNHQLLEKALEAAKQIADDKERAQALLDIINEINYFSQSSQVG